MKCPDLDCDVCRQSAEEHPPQVPAPIEFGPDPDYDVAQALATYKRAGGSVAEHSAWAGVKVHSNRVLVLYTRIRAAALLVLLALASSSACVTTCPPAAHEGHVDPKCCVGIPCYYPEPSAADAGPE